MTNGMTNLKSEKIRIVTELLIKYKIPYDRRELEILSTKQIAIRIKNIRTAYKV